jgi:arylsulfatase A-like enzyme
MHFRTHAKPESRGRAGRWQSEYHDTMLDHDDIVGDLLDALDELGPGRDTIVMYSTDNGPHMNTWPDSGMTPFRNEKNSNWEGAYRVPCVVRWPGRIPAGRVLNGIVSHNDWFTTLARRGRRHRRGRSPAPGHRARRHRLQGPPRRPRPARLPDRRGRQSPRQHFFYVSDDGDLTAIRYDNWKVVFCEQRATGTLQVWAEPYTVLRVPKIFNLRTDPFERADITSNTYWDWLLDRAWVVIPIQAYVAQMLQTLVEFPPSQSPASFTIDDMMAKLKAGFPSS